jgi:hypothetical protein
MYRFIVPLRPENNPVSEAYLFGHIPHPVTMSIGKAAEVLNSTILRHHGVVVEASNKEFLTLEFNYEGLDWDSFLMPIRPEEDIKDWKPGSSLFQDHVNIQKSPFDLLQVLESLRYKEYNILAYNCQHFANDILDKLR